MTLTNKINACTTKEQLDEILSEVLTELSNHAAYLTFKDKGPVNSDAWSEEVNRQWKNFVHMMELKS